MPFPDDFHPTNIKLKSKDLQALTPATKIESIAYLFYTNHIQF
jgi:hypothetical protein